MRLFIKTVITLGAFFVVFSILTKIVITGLPPPQKTLGYLNISQELFLFSIAVSLLPGVKDK